MSQNVPLVRYDNGVRKVIGEALVATDGTVTANITDEKSIKELSRNFFSFSIPTDTTGESEIFTD